MSEYNWMALEELTPRQAWDKLCDAETRLAVAIALEEALVDANMKRKSALDHLKTDIEQIELLIPMLVRDAREALADVFCDIKLKPNGQEENEEEYIDDGKTVDIRPEVANREYLKQAQEILEGGNVERRFKLAEMVTCLWIDQQKEAPTDQPCSQ